MTTQRVLLAWTAAALTAVSAAMADPTTPQRQPPTPQPVTINGTLDSLDRGRLQVTTTPLRSRQKPRTWFVAVTPDTKWTVNATATVEYLKTNLLVQFKAELDEKDRAKDKVADLTVLTPSRETRQGVFADQGGGSGHASDPGVGIGREHDVADAPKQAEPDDLDLGSVPGLGTAKKSKVVGRIGAIDGDDFTVRAGSRVIRFTLADLPVISVSLTDPRLTVPGSKVVIRGMGTRGRKNRCLANDVTVTLATPLSGAGKKKPDSSKSHPQASAAN